MVASLPVGTVFIADSTVETRGKPKKNLSPEEAKRYTRVHTGQWVYSKSMWWVVVQPYPQHCSCLPIKTYRGQGTTKPGAEADHHAILYDSREEKATPLLEEASLSAYAVVLNSDGNHIDATTRVDFSKVTPIENYRKRRIIGSIHHSDIQQFKRHYRRVQFPETHEYEITLKCPLALPASYIRAVIDGRSLDIDQGSSMQLVVLIVRKKYVYVWQCCICGLVSFVGWPLISTIICWKGCEWGLGKWKKKMDVGSKLRTGILNNRSCALLGLHRSLFPPISLHYVLLFIGTFTSTHRRSAEELGLPSSN